MREREQERGDGGGKGRYMCKRWKEQYCEIDGELYTECRQSIVYTIYLV